MLDIDSKKCGNVENHCDNKCTNTQDHEGWCCLCNDNEYDILCYYCSTEHSINQVEQAMLFFEDF